MPSNICKRGCCGIDCYKQRSPDDSGRWASIFRLFFDEFPTVLRACFEKLGQIADGRPDAPMAVWKFVGEEILFVAELNRHEEAAYHVLAFKEAINQYSLQLKQKPELAGLSLKGTVWGAGFPVMNVEVAPKLGDGEGASSPRDYLGPCIDQGFRLCSLADVRRIPLSIDIAYFLASTNLNLGERFKIKVQCEEPRNHKGVPFPYPHIWLDREDGKRTNEDDILRRPPLYDPSNIKSYLDELFRRKQPGLFRPFIVTDPSVLFHRIDEEMNTKRSRMLQTVDAESSYVSGEPNAPASPVDVPPPRPPS